MSKMYAEIGRIVDDVSIRVTQYDILYEAITNAIHANAKNITCKFNSFDNPTQEDGKDSVERKVDTISVIDDGVGLNDDNYKSFCNYRTEYKKEYGCKGVGRFVFLKVYNKVTFQSQLLKEQEKRTFDFDIQFDTDNLKSEEKDIKANRTELNFISLTPLYLDLERHHDRRIGLNLKVIKEKVLLHLIPALHFYKKRAVQIKIEFINETNNEILSITDIDIPNFDEIRFPVKDSEGKEHNFVLSYKINNVDGDLSAYYCANNRTVCEFADKDMNISLPYNYSGFLLIESEYLDSRVNNARNNFDIYPIKTDLFNTISWEMINSSVKAVISGIVKNEIPETEAINISKLEEIHNERPYLVGYIEEEDIDIAGFLDERQIIEKAKRRFDAAKEKILTNAGKETYTDEELKEAIELTQNELVSYINDRAQVLERLIKLVGKKEQVEKVIHNLFMEKQSEDDYFCIGKNNLWLLDDRFTSYSYAASDKKIKDVLSSVGESTDGIENVKDKPDLSLFFSHNPEHPERLKSVLVEIKPFDYEKKSDRKKFQGIQQLLDYVEAFKDREKIEEVFAYLLTDIDEKLARRLEGDGYIPLYSMEAPIFHRFYDKRGISIYVVSAKTLIMDAESRNRVFLEIIRKQSRLNKIFSRAEK